MKVLIIEDERRLADFMSKGLSESGFNCQIANDGKTGANYALKEDFDIILMDLNLPEMNGFDLCKFLRESDCQIPIILISALSGSEQIVQGLDAGADDYIVKPFKFQELLARMRSNLRRSQNAGTNGVKSKLLIADLEVDINSKTVSRAGKVLVLSAKEFFILEFLAKNKNMVVSKAQIFSEVWDINEDLDSSKVEVYINLLRKKVDHNYDQKLIHTVVGMGYVLRVD
jgi:two-component system, OmpR family, copper resistance phosphate regulon response regulator CusR